MGDKEFNHPFRAFCYHSVFYLYQAHKRMSPVPGVSRLRCIVRVSFITLAGRLEALESRIRISIQGASHS